MHCKSVKWPHVSGGRRSFRPTSNGHPFIKFDEQLVDDLSLGLKGRWQFGAGLDGHRPPDTGSHLAPMQYKF